MITGIAIENFKGIRERVEIKLRPITLLFGANSAGKSSILHALHYAVELFERHNADAYQTVTGGPQLNLGGFANIVHGHDLNSTIWLKFNLKDSEDLLASMDEVDFDHVVYEHLQLRELEWTIYQFAQPTDEGSVEIGVRWDFISGQPHIAIYRLYFRDRILAEITSEPHARRVYLSQLDLAHPVLNRFSDVDVRGDEERAATPLSDLVPIPDESLLSVCLRDSMQWFQRISGGNPNSPDKSTFLLFEDATCALPEPGSKSLRLCLKSRDDVFGSDELVNAELDEQLESGECEWGRTQDIAHSTAFGLTRLLFDPVEVVRKSLGGFRYLGPIREVTQRNHVPSRIGERERWASGVAAWDLLATSSEKFIDSVSQWLGDEDRLNSGFHLRLKRFKELDLSDPLVVQLLTGRAFDEAEVDAKLDLSKVPTKSRVLIVPRDDSIELSPSDVGIGISQVVPVIITALDGSSRFIAIEQPELHLHPRLQAEIADLFLEAVKHRNHQFLIETHSEHCILRLQRRIRETTKGTSPDDRSLMSEDIVVYHVSSEDGCTRLRRIDVDKNGEFVQPWPDDFFEIDFYERFGR